MIEREGDGPVDSQGNALKGWDYNGDGACCDEFDGFLEPASCGTGKGHGKVLDTPIYNPTAEEIFDINGVGKTCYQCFNMTQDWKTAYKAVEEPPPVRRRLQDVCYDDLTTCLLYTSPSPRDVEESRMPSSA